MAQKKIPVPDWMKNLDEHAKNRVAKLTMQTDSSNTNSESDISVEFSVTPAQAAAAISWVRQKSFASTTNAISSTGESPKVKVSQPPMKTRSSNTPKKAVPSKDASKGSEPPKVASRRWGRSPRREGRDKRNSTATTRKLPTHRYRRRRKRSRISPSMVSEITRLIVKVLQLKGAMTLGSLAQQLCCRQEDVQNILNGLWFVWFTHPIL